MTADAEQKAVCTSSYRTTPYSILYDDDDAAIAAMSGAPIDCASGLEFGMCDSGGRAYRAACKCACRYEWDLRPCSRDTNFQNYVGDAYRTEDGITCMDWAGRNGVPASTGNKCRRPAPHGLPNPYDATGGGSWGEEPWCYLAPNNPPYSLVVRLDGGMTPFTTGAPIVLEMSMGSFLPVNRSVFESALVAEVNTTLRVPAARVERLASGSYGSVESEFVYVFRVNQTNHGWPTMASVQTAMSGMVGTWIVNRTVLLADARILSGEDLLFPSVDTDHSGVLNSSEISTMMRSFFEFDASPQYIDRLRARFGGHERALRASNFRELWEVLNCESCDGRFCVAAHASAGVNDSHVGVEPCLDIGDLLASGQLWTDDGYVPHEQLWESYNATGQYRMMYTNETQFALQMHYTLPTYATLPGFSEREAERRAQRNVVQGVGDATPGASDHAPAGRATAAYPTECATEKALRWTVTSRTGSSTGRT